MSTINLRRASDTIPPPSINGKRKSKEAEPVTHDDQDHHPNKKKKLEKNVMTRRVRQFIVGESMTSVLNFLRNELNTTGDKRIISNWVSV